MILLARFVGLLIMVLGFAIFASPQFSNKIFDFFKEGKRITYAGIGRCVLGLILFLSASQSIVPLAAIALGLMFWISGLVVLALDVKKIQAIIAAYSDLPSLVMRMMGLLALSFGILIIAVF